MKLPNRYGSVYKMKGRRRKPYRVVISRGFNCDGNIFKSKRLTLGHFVTKNDQVLEALVNYHQDPYELKAKSITFEELYVKWSEQHFKSLINKSACRTFKAAIESAKVGNATKARMKSMYNLMYRYAIKQDILDKNYAKLYDPVKVLKKNCKITFTSEEVNKLWENIDEISFIDMILVGIYTGFRPSELTILKTKDIHLDKGDMIGGIKSEAGRNRVAPIHRKIHEIINERYDEKNEYLFNDYNKLTKEVTSLTYDKYRGRFNKAMIALKMERNPHETRHTFITQAKYCNVNDYVLKKIIGHEVSDVTDSIYTHRSIDNLKNEIIKIIF